MIWKAFLAIALLLNIVTFSRAAFTCDISNFPEPVKYPVLPDIFQTRVEISYITEKKSAFSFWHYDYSKRQACVEFKEDNSIRKNIFNYETDEVFFLEAVNEEPIIPPPYEGQPIYPMGCETEMLSNYSTSTIYDFGKVLYNGKFYPKVPKDLFKFNPDAINGTKLINGIVTDVYLKCQHEATGNYLITYYISNGEHMPDGDSVPIRANFKGEKLDSSGTMKPFEIELNFYEFRKKIKDYSVFQTPSTVYCYNRKKTVDLPKIGNVFSHSEESVNKDNEIAYIRNINYNYDMKLVSYELASDQNSTIDYFQNDPLVYINDYNVGIQYVLNKQKGNCSIRGVREFDNVAEDTEFEKDQAAKLSYILRMKSPEQYFRFDADYVKTSTRLVNGIMSDKYVAGVNLYQVDSVFEYSFSNSNVTVADDESSQQNVLVAVNIQSENVKDRGNYYNFAKTKPPMSAYDTGKCFLNKDKLRIRLMLPLSEYGIDASVVDTQYNLIDQINDVLMKQTGEQSLRFSQAFISLDDKDNMQAYISILPRPPIMDLFTLAQDLFLLHAKTVEKYYDTTVENCAMKCIENIQCLSFDFSKFSKTCYLNDQHYTNTSNTPATSFIHYSRNTLKATEVKESFKIYNQIEDLIKTKELFIEFEVKSRMDINLNVRKGVPVKSIEKLTGTINRFGTTSLLDNYKLKYADYKMVGSIDKTFFDFTVDDCAKECNELSGGECKSFDFYYLNGECRLSRSRFPSIGDVNIKAAKHWDIYEKDDLFHYNKPVKTLENPQDFKLSAVASAADCAARCDGATNLQCKSFNFCERNNLCYLSETHMAEISDDPNYVTNCEHYSKKYLFDFKYTNSEELPLDAEIVLKELSLDECSKECVTADGFKCESFDYCNTDSGSKACLLNSGDKEISESSIHLKFGDCAHYQRTYFYDTNLVTNILIKGKKDNSPKVFTAMVIVFVIAGIVGGVVVTIVLAKKKMLQ